MAHEAVYLDLALEFGQNCSAKVDDSARRVLKLFFDENFLCLLEKGDMKWDDPADRAFAMYCARDLARAASDEQAGIVTEAVVVEAARKRIPAWEDICHLPPGKCGVVDRRGGCVIMRGLVGLSSKEG